MTEPREPNPNATIQIDADALADLELLTNATQEGSEAPARPSRATPPPLPPEMQAPAPPEKKRPMALILALFVVLLGVVIFAGIRVGQWLRPPTPAAASAQIPSSTPSASASAAAPRVITIPTIEMNDTPQ